MARSIQNTVILVKVETTSGTDAAPTNVADAVLLRVTNLSVKIDQQFADRDLIRGYFGGADKLPYTRRGNISFSVDLASSSALGTAPQWGDLLIGCAMAETVTASARVDYLPISTALKTLTVWAHVDGALRKFTYCAGDFKISMKPGISPTIDFNFMGLVTDPSAAAVPTPTLTAWQRPQAIGPANTAALLLGGSYSAGAITGGTAFNFSDLNWALNNDLQDLVLVSQESVAVFGRAPTVDFTLDLTAAQEVTQFTNMKAGTTTSVGVVHGSASPGKVLVFAGTGVITGVEDAVQGNVLLTKISMSILPSSAGNDDLRVVAI
jgi:Phage tail tube protein